SVTPSDSQCANNSRSGLPASTTICGAPSRPSDAQAALRSAILSSIPASVGVVIQPSAERAIQANVFGPPAAPTTTGRRGCCTVFGQAQDGPNCTNSPSY